MQAELHSWLTDAGYPGDIELTPLRGDFGSTSMWVLSSPQIESPRVMRLFPSGSTSAEREARSMTAAAGNGVPVPHVFTRGEIHGRPLLVTSFIEGSPAARALVGDTADAHAFGLTIGEILGRINEVEAPDKLHDDPDAWLSWGGEALPKLRHLLTALPDQNRLLHFDYHLLNIMVHDGRVTGVIDWENATAGPPHLDLARSRAILHVAAIGNLATGVTAEQIAAFDRGLVEGHARIVGPDPFPELSEAWGLSMTVYDFSKHLGKPGNRTPESLIRHLAAERDAAIERVLARQDALA